MTCQLHQQDSRSQKQVSRHTMPCRWPTSGEDATALHAASFPEFQSLLIDPGAYANLADLSWVRAAKAQSQGLMVSQNRLTGHSPSLVSAMGLSNACGRQSCLSECLRSLRGKKRLPSVSSRHRLWMALEQVCLPCLDSNPCDLRTLS